MTTVFVAGDTTFNSLIYLGAFPEPRPQTVFSSGFNETVGGTAAGKALNLNRLGLDVTLHSMIGADAPGAAIRAYLARENLTLIADVDLQGTQRHVNLMAVDGGRISIYVQYASFEPEIDLAPIENAIRHSDVVALNLSNYCRRLIPLAKKHGKPIWCDIHNYDGVNEYHQDFINGADVVTMSSDALPDYRSYMAALIAAGKEWVICTHGRSGATALTPTSEWIEIPALTSYAQQDTNGAGDSFFAGVLYGYTQSYPLWRCMQLGTIVAGLCITSTELFYPDLSAELVEQEYARHYPASSR